MSQCLVVSIVQNEQGGAEASGDGFRYDLAGGDLPAENVVLIAQCEEVSSGRMRSRSSRFKVVRERLDVQYFARVTVERPFNHRFRSIQESNLRVHGKEEMCVRDPGQSVDGARKTSVDGRQLSEGREVEECDLSVLFRDRHLFVCRVSGHCSASVVIV